MECVTHKLSSCANAHSTKRCHIRKCFHRLPYAQRTYCERGKTRKLDVKVNLVAF